MIDRPTVNINELIEILAIPEIEDIIWKKLESLKTDEPAKFIRLYREKKKALRQEIFENKRKEAEETDKARHDDLRGNRGQAESAAFSSAEVSASGAFFVIGRSKYYEKS